MPERISVNWVGLISIDTASAGDGGNLERAGFESLEAGITIPSYLGRYKNGSSRSGRAGGGLSFYVIGRDGVSE